MLILSESEREELLSLNALDFDSEGDEVLRGLTVSETLFILAVGKTALENVGAAESNVYHQLRQRHAYAVERFEVNIDTYLRTVCGTRSAFCNASIARKFVRAAFAPIPPQR